MSKERNQNPTVGDTVTLRLITYNSNLLRNVSSVEKIEIYKLDATLCSDSNPDGRYLVETITDFTNESVGNYHIDLLTPGPQYTIGKYLDVWHVVFEDNDETVQIANRFEIYPDLWYTSTTPAVYGFDFQFQPNRIRKGSVKWLIIKIIPNVPRATEIERYYTNLAISSNLKINIEQTCGPCTNEEIIVEDECVTVRDKVFGYYKLDTSESGLDLDCGIYNVWFTLQYAETTDISPKMNFQIY